MLSFGFWLFCSENKNNKVTFENRFSLNMFVAGCFKEGFEEFKELNEK